MYIYDSTQNAERFDGYAPSERALDFLIEQQYDGWPVELPEDREFARQEDFHVR